MSILEGNPDSLDVPNTQVKNGLFGIQLLMDVVNFNGEILFLLILRPRSKKLLRAGIEVDPYIVTKQKMCPGY